MKIVLILVSQLGKMYACFGKRGTFFLNILTFDIEDLLIFSITQLITVWRDGITLNAELYLKHKKFLHC